MNKPRILAFYLPQFHPTPENDEWWGKGFTEWTNVAKAKPLFKGHKQPKIPADLGFYDLRVPETRKAQANLARQAGVDGFCYWHYWFEPGKEILQRPFNEVVATGEPDFPFCLAWANESWYAKLWDKDKKKDRLLVEQKYLGKEDYEKHFYSLLAAFKDKRYLREDGKLVFVIYKPLASEQIKEFMAVWQELAKKEGLNGFYFIAHIQDAGYSLEPYKEMGFDSVNSCMLWRGFRRDKVINRIIYKLERIILRKPLMASYNKVVKGFFDKNTESDAYICPTIIPRWDHTPRSGIKGTVMLHDDPNVFYNHAAEVLKNTKAPFVFLKSWNEWAEGNYMEPDREFGLAYVEALNKAVKEYQEK